MGQRTAIILKRNFADGTQRLDMLHEQSGGDSCSFLPSIFMRDMINVLGLAQWNLGQSNYPYSMTLKEATIGREPKEEDTGDYIVDSLVTASAWNNERVGKIIPPDIDIWDLSYMKHLISLSFNNNGAMLIEITERYEPCFYGKNRNKETPDSYEESFRKISEIKLGFVQGGEQADDAYTKIVDAETFMKAFSDYDKNFAKCFNAFCKFAKVKQVTK